MGMFESASWYDSYSVYLSRSDASIIYQLARPKLKGVDLPMIQKIVVENDKQRYQLVQEADEIAGSTEGAICWIRANQGHTLKVIVKIFARKDRELTRS